MLFIYKVCFLVVTIIIIVDKSNSDCPVNCKTGQTCTAVDSGCDECEEAYYGRQCQHPRECRSTTKGQEYRGVTNTTQSGRTCQRWDSTVPHSHDLPAEPHNFCRNPDNYIQPWCYTIDPDERYELCDIPMCDDQCSAPLIDRPYVVITNPPSGGFVPGYMVQLGCVTGYEHTGGSSSNCSDLLTWDGFTLPDCKIVECPAVQTTHGGIQNLKDKYVYQDSISIICDTGYDIIGNNTLTCQADKTWAGVLPSCQIKECPAPALYNQSLITNTNSSYVYGDEININCEEGYTLHGQSTLLCLANKTWDNQPPLCTINECPAPSLNEHSNTLITNSSYVYGDEINVSCEEGYTLHGESTLLCLANSTWDNQPPTCLINECPVSAIDANSVISNNKTYYYRDFLVIECNTGYTIQGNKSLQCESDKTWSQPMPTCKIVECPQVHIPHGSIKSPKDKYVYRDTVNIVCDVGYKILGNNELMCRDDSTWADVLPVCQVVECPVSTIQIKHGRVQSPKNKYVYQDSLTVVCDTGYNVTGNNVLTCTADKTWSGALPSCQIKECTEPQVNEHVYIKSPKITFVYQDEVTFGCDTGYTVTGSEKTQCLEDTTWSNNPPTCAVNECPQPLLDDKSNITNAKSRYVYGDQIDIVCINGYSLQGRSKLVCLADETWDHESPNCTVTCQAPSIDINSVITNKKTVYYHGDLINIECNNGYTIHGNKSLQCKGDKNWTDPVPYCKQNECRPPHLYPNSVISNTMTVYRYGDKITVACEPGYTPRGEGVLECMANKSWSHPVPTCKEYRYRGKGGLIGGVVGGIVAVLVLGIAILFVLWRRKHIPNADSNGDLVLKENGMPSTVDTDTQPIAYNQVALSNFADLA